MLEVHRDVVEVIFVPRSIAAAKQQACRDLKPEDVTVRVGGRKARVTAIDHHQEPLLIRVVLDVSVSMPPEFMLEAQRGIQELASLLDEADRIALTSFSLDTRLLMPPTPPSTPLIWPQHVGLRGSTVWEATLEVLRQSAAMEREAAILLISDGLDPSESFEDLVLELRAARGNVAPIISVSPRAATKVMRMSRDSRARARSRLLSLANLTGGVLLEEMAALRRSAPLVVERLRGRADVSYAIEAPAPTDADVQVELPPRISCRAEVIARRPVGDEFSALLDTGSSADVGPLLRRLGWPAPPSAIANVLLLREWNPSMEPTAPAHEAWALQAPRVLVSRLPVVIADDLLITAWNAYETTGEYHVTSNSNHDQVTGLRPVLLAVPPLATVTGRLRSAADVTLWLMSSGASTRVDSETWPIVGSPVVVEGVTALKWQEAFGGALCASYEDYAAWAAARRDRAIERRLSHLLQSRPAPSDSAREALRSAISKRASASGRWEHWSFVGGLLGEVSLQEVARDVDRRLADRRSCAERRSGTNDDSLPHDPDASWARLLEFFPPAVPVRSVVPLVPSYSAAEDRIGFWRIAMPHGHIAQPGEHFPSDFVPEAPLAARAIGEALSRGALKPCAWNVDAVRYSRTSSQLIGVEVTLVAASNQTHRGILSASFSRRVAEPAPRFEIEVIELRWTDAENGAVLVP